ncbi:MAG TPA: aldehyde ferredoxin oxidoreductase family protein, partial [Acidimicrobiia bacterium]|nr:aldehyde ferredoxin oxidoreductase family protein [Acidimicrobiia bacterium]
MHGWTGQILRVDLTTRTHHIEPFSEEFAHTWIGGRGFAVKILYDELRPGIDPLGPENKLVVAVGPISGISAPNTGKTVVAAKSPMTGGYGDGNLGTRVTEKLRKAGYDALIVEGRAERPTLLYVDDERVEFVPADEIWGKGTYEANDWIYARYGKGAGVLNIGQAGENLVRYAVVRSMEGRSGGRPGMGAVMGSKLLKAIVVKGSLPIPQAFPAEMKTLGRDDLRTVHAMDQKAAWSVQGTTGVLPWCNEVAALPVHNFRKTHHSEAWRVDGQRLAEAKVAVYGCPNCTMQCGIAMLDTEGRESELDYENVGLLGPNLDLFDLQQVATLNYLCDDFGVDTMSAGGVLSFYADAIEQGAVEGDLRFGDFAGLRDTLTDIALRRGPVGNLLAEGTMRAAWAVGRGSEAYAMQVKGLEVSAYNCKFIPGMALAFGVSPIGAHHKESWIISYEITQTPRESYGRDKAQKVVDLQRIRGGMFEAIVSCRFPWVELGWGLENYPKYYNAITGLDWELEDFWPSSDRIYAIMKLFWLREHPGTDRKDDYPPAVWFDPANADTEGPIAGRHLEYDRYDALLQHYSDIRGYDERG